MSTSPADLSASPPSPAGGLRELLRLAVPLIAGHSGGQLMSFVDTAMVGRLGPAALGAVGIGNGVFFALTVVGMGSVLGMDPIITQALGAGEHVQARRTLWQGVRVALAMSVPIMALIALSSFLMKPIGVEPDTAAATQSFLFGRIPNVIPFLVFSATRSYLQAAGGARVIILAMVAANITNLIGNSLLIYGDDGLRSVGLPTIGLPPLGVLGSGLASSFASAVSLLVCIRGIRAIETPPDAARRRADPALLRKIVVLGLPIGLQLLAEVGAFTIASLLAGRMGKGPAAGYQIAITLASFTFTVSLGIASAASVLVGRAVGRGDTPAARRAGFMALRASAAFMALGAIAFIAAPALLSRILTDKADIIAAAVPLVQIAGVFQLSDGAQAVAAGALRGAGDTWSAPRANIIGYYLVGLPIAVGLALGLGLGAPGLWWGLSAGLTVVAIGLTLQFHRISKKPLVRV